MIFYIENGWNDDLKGVPTVIFFCHDRPRVGGPMCSTPPSGHYNIFKKIGLHGFFVAQQ